MKFNVYRNGVLVYEGIEFNHATGVLYRSQEFGHAVVDVFQIQRDLRAGACSHPAFQGLYAISWKATGGSMGTLAQAQEAAHILQVAGHFE